MYESVARIYTRGNFILSTKEKVKGKGVKGIRVRGKKVRISKKVKGEG